MSDLMNLYFIKQHILEIKLELAKVAIEKQNCIKNQYYEKAFEFAKRKKHCEMIFLIR